MNSRESILPWHWPAPIYIHASKHKRDYAGKLPSVCSCFLTADAVFKGRLDRIVANDDVLYMRMAYL